MKELDEAWKEAQQKIDFLRKLNLTPDKWTWELHLIDAELDLKVSEWYTRQCVKVSEKEKELIVESYRR